MDQVIALVGGGATALAFTHTYIQEYEADAQLPGTIYLFEKRACFGPGAAYGPDTASNLLNTKTGFITPFHDRPGDFHAWLGSKEDLWRPHFPHFEPDPNSYAPRPLFGMYLQDRMSWLIREALAKGIRIVQIHAEVKDVVQMGRSHVVKTDCSLTLKADHVFLTCGTLPERKQGEIALSPRVLASPYPVAALPSKIPSAARVAVVGARLSCIDAVIGLVEGGHTGHIAIYSRSGHFPSVRGTQGRIVTQHLTAEKVEALACRKGGGLKVTDLMGLVRQEIAEVSQIPLDAVPTLDAPPAPPENLMEHLKAEIAASRHDRPWQAVLYATNAIVDRLWQALEDSERRLFMAEYMSAFMAFRVSIPVENAQKILSYLESGQLSFHPGEFSLGLDAQGRPVMTPSNGNLSPRRYDKVIKATGSPRALASVESDLMAQLMRRGEVTPHSMGGLQVDPVSYEVIDAAGRRNPSMRALGELTNGTFFFTSALDINARHARACALAFNQRQQRQRVPAVLTRQRRVARTEGVREVSGL